MDDLEHTSDVEIVDLDPPDEKVRHTLHRIVLRLTQKRAFSVRISPIFALVICIVSMLVMPLMIQADVPSTAKLSQHVPLSTPSRTALIVDRASVVDMAIDHQVTYINSDDGIISARRSSDGKLLWQHRAPPGVNLDLVAADGKLFSTSISSPRGAVEAYRANDGVLLWASQLPPFGPYPLLVSDGVVYVNTQADDGTVFALRASDGRVLWHFAHQNPSPMDSFLAVAHGIAAIRTADSLVHVLRTSDGSEIFRYQSLDDWVPSVEGQTIYFATAQNGLQARRITDGRLLWQSPTNTPRLGSWTVQNGVIYLSTASGMMQALRDKDGSLLWQRQTGDIASGPYVQGTNVLYFTPDKMAFALSTQNGALLWQRIIVVPKFSLMVMNGVFFLDENGVLVSAWRSSDATLLWHFAASDSILWEPQLVDGLLYLRQFNGTMDVLRVSDGKVLWQYFTG